MYAGSEKEVKAQAGTTGDKAIAGELHHATLLTRCAMQHTLQDTNQVLCTRHVEHSGQGALLQFGIEKEDAYRRCLMHQLMHDDPPEDELLLELLLSSLEVDESSDDDDSSLLLESESSEDDAGFFRFFLSSLAAGSSCLPFLASPGSSSEAPRNLGLYCRKHNASVP